MTPDWKFRLSVHSLFRFEILNCTIHIMVFTFLDVYVCNVFDSVSSQMLKKSESHLCKIKALTILKNVTKCDPEIS